MRFVIVLEERARVSVVVTLSVAFQTVDRDGRVRRGIHRALSDGVRYA